MIMGDFNAVLRLDDRINGSQIQELEVRDFGNLLIDT